MSLPTITLTGNVVDDPSIRYLSSGVAAATVRVACTDRRFNRETNQWEDGKKLFINVELWRQEAENAAETLRRGTTVMVNGTLEQETYTDRDGNSRTAYKVAKAEIGAALGNQTAQVSKTTRQAENQTQQSAALPAQRTAPTAAAAQPVDTGGFLAEPPF